MIATGARPATAHQVHRTICTALGEAVLRGQVQENVATLAKALKIEAKEPGPAAPLWVEAGRVFTDRFGRAVKPNSDYHAWKALLKRVGARETRLHDARHTAATVVLALEVPGRTVMGVMGWSSTSLAAHHQHVTDPIRHEVASRVGGLLWSLTETN